MARRTIGLKDSWERSHDMVAHVADSLAIAGHDGDTEVGALAPPVEGLLERWALVDVERRAAHRGLVRAHALVQRRDAFADLTVEQAHVAALSFFKLDRGAAGYRQLFPDPLHLLVRMGLESQLSPMRLLATRFVDSPLPADERTRHIEALRLAVTRGEEAIRNREEAYVAAAKIAARIASWKDDANNVLLGVEGALKSIAASRKLDRRFVEAFFPPTRRRPASDEDDVEDARNAPIGD